MAYEGYIDPPAHYLDINGWVVNKENPNETITLELYLNGEIFTTLTTAIYREDIKDAHHTDGMNGFHYTLPHHCLSQGIASIALKVKDSDYWLNGSPFIIYGASALQKGIHSMQAMLEFAALALTGFATVACAISMRRAHIPMAASVNAMNRRPT